MTNSTRSFWVDAAGISDPGRLREDNQDSYLVAGDRYLYIVSDGLGGHQAGSVASQAVVHLLPKLLEPRMKALTSQSNKLVEVVLRETALELSRAIRAKSVGRLGLQGMGATLEMVWIRPQHAVAHLVHMGDSRIYQLRQGQLIRLTKDHSVIALLIKYGEITPQQALDHPARSRISRYIGMEGDVYPDVVSIPLQDGDRLLLCSDGLTDMLSDEQILQTWHNYMEPEQACLALRNAANAAGGTDNITALAVNWKQIT